VGNALTSTATQGVVTSAGTGSPNRLLFSLLTGGGTPPPPPPLPGSPPCTICEHFTGNLSGTGDADIHPNGTFYFSAVSGTHNGWLRGPKGTDFDMYLQRWFLFGWFNVAVSESVTSEEVIAFNGAPGYYRWRVVSFSGSGAYDFWLRRP
jgi:hypothetical protein